MRNHKFENNNGFAFNLDNITKAIDDFFAGNNLKSAVPTDACHQIPLANVWQDEQGLVLELAAPGLSKEDFQISVDADLLTIEAKQSVKKAGENVKVFRKEFSYSTFKRSFRLDSKEFDVQQIAARYEQGILSLRIPRKAENKSESIRINIL